MEALVYASGAIVLLMIVAIFVYLSKESRYAFDRKFTYGFRFAVQPTDAQPEDIQFDPTASVIAVHVEGDDALDSKEELAPLPTLESMKGFQFWATGATLAGAAPEPGAANVFVNEFRSPKRAEDKGSFRLYAFATEEYKAPTMRLAWDVNEDAEPGKTPFRLTLKLVQAPEGVAVDPIEIDLKAKPKGSVEVPSYIARNEDERTKGYVFAIEQTPTTSSFMATVGAFLDSDWGPTLAQPRFGFLPLLFSTLLITLIALAVATPISIASAIYLSELAPTRIREWLKPIIELLASIPTVVLAYFGLMLVAPAVAATVAASLGMQSGRNLLTTALVMGILLIPTITTLAEDALRNVPSHLRDGGGALGLTKRETLKRILLPAAKAGMVAAVMLGMARAIGETMVVWILSGGTATMPSFSSPTDAAQNLVRPTRGIPDTIGIEMGNVTFEEPHYGHLFLLGLVIFIITLAINLWAFRYARRHAWRH